MTITTLQDSAIDLYRRMIHAGQADAEGPA